MKIQDYVAWWDIDSVILVSYVYRDLLLLWSGGFSGSAVGRPRYVVVFVVFSERELMFTFAICYRPSVCRLYLSVCRL